MQIEVYGQHIEVTDALRSYGEDKMSRLERHFEQPMQVRLQLELDKPHHRAVGHVRVAGADYHADASAQTMYAAIDLLTDKLDRVLVKHKQKLHDRARRNDSAAREGAFG
ncbi:ribosome hibernation-promoting factor, HPF/YfiA family [Luteimonas sp. e5]